MAMQKNKLLIKLILIVVLSSATLTTIKARAQSEVVISEPVNHGASKNDLIFSVVEKQPEFPGGFVAFGQFLSRNIRYPAEDRKNGIQGKVIVQFVVERDGSLSDIRALRGPSKTEMDESVRVLSMSPKWVPGMQNGKPVRVKYTVPINFTLGAGDTKSKKSDK
jgi:protein TonB